MVSIAIDGPAGAGKSTVAQKIAEKIGFTYVDTGAIYRTVGLYMLEHGVNLSDKKEILKLLPKVEISLKFKDGIQKMILCETDVSEKIRMPKISMVASEVSAIKEVRDFLFDLQKNFAKEYNVLMDGRDIGTVVLPNADIKIFLTATAEERAKRRYKETREKGIDVTFEDVLSDIKKRDYNDINRKTAPLKPADDALIIDTTGNTLEQSIAQILEVIKRKLNLKMEVNI